MMRTMNEIRVTYLPGIFDVADQDAAKRIILTADGASTEHRWLTETPYLTDLVASAVPLTGASLVLDYGCGIGRIAKALIERTGCKVIGADISPSMRALAVGYVDSPNFLACPPEMLDELVARGLVCDAALAVWVLQHCPRLADDIVRIARTLKSGGDLFVVNQRVRAVPTERGWLDDGLDVFGLLRSTFEVRSEGPLTAAHTTDVIARIASWAAFRRL
jgi:SAM-dependent methyltransferase